MSEYRINCNASTKTFALMLNRQLTPVKNHWLAEGGGLAPQLIGRLPGFYQKDPQIINKGTGINCPDCYGINGYP
ncbi:hypothetical protein DMA11_13990 [Marinilabiliaceae bacterium JC017]|nr:hypothetical protein DMA11_13990 [Marinilabiliaceae bacterium JC017]